MNFAVQAAAFNTVRRNVDTAQEFLRNVNKLHTTSPSADESLKEAAKLLHDAAHTIDALRKQDGELSV